jgi:D-alanine-D-alanine ligase
MILDARGHAVILEVNSIPGLTPTSLLPKAAGCVGVSYDALCEQLVQMACPPTNRRKTPGRLPIGGGAQVARSASA